MGEAGILPEDASVELLDGDIIVMPPINDWHASNVKLLNNTMLPPLQGRAVVGIQDPVRLDDGSEPQPDVSILRWRDDFYAHGKPTPADVLLLIEVSDSTLSYDRNVKLAAYARAGIPEVWIANRPDRRIEAYTDPAGDAYAAVRYYVPGDTIAPQQFPDVSLDVGLIIPDDPSVAPDESN